MSQNDTETLSLTQNRDFRADTRIRDPQTGLEYVFPCEIDTGNPDAISLPRNHSYKFTNKLGEVGRTGAGTANSECFEVEIVRYRTLDLNFETMGVMTLPNDSQHGLIGIDLLRMLDVEIYDQPDQKKMDLTTAHI